MPSDSAILNKIEQQPKRAATFKQLVRELGARGDARRLLADHLRDLVRSRRLVESPGGVFSLPAPPAAKGSAKPAVARGKNLVSGRLTMHRDGYGFVIPDDPELRQKIEGDIYISQHAVGTAMHGDSVLVELGNIRAGGRAEGRIVQVAQRAHATVVGTFHYGPRHNYVTPIDEKLRQDVIIPRGMERPRAAEEPEGAPSKRSLGGGVSEHRVLGEEARRRAVRWDDLENVVVDVELTDWPSPTQSPRGRVVEVLGYEDDFGVDVEIIIRKFHLPHRFPGHVLREAESFDDIVSRADLRGRRDFRDLPIVTIDGETARDFDDAVLVRKLENGNFQLQVHIADVAHYVRPGSALDAEAQLRGTSVYFPDRAVPMLPLELSTDICSLRPQVDRLVLSCLMELDHRGEVLGYELCPGVIRSAERMTYTDVFHLLEGDAALRRRYHPLVEGFELMRELALILNRKRERRGSIDFDLPEAIIEFDEEGLMQGVTRSIRNIAHRLIEEFMLAANECVASYLEEKQVASLYRIHEKPDPKKVYEFEQLAAAFGYSLGVGALPVQRVQLKADRRARHGSGSRPQPVELPKEVHLTPHMYQKLTRQISGKPEERILSYLMLRSLKQARYSEENAGHFALAAPTYTHFTSPIRRYPDLIVHRILKGVLEESAEAHEGEVPVGRGVPAHSESASPWSRAAAERERAKPGSKSTNQRVPHPSRSEGWERELSGSIPLARLHDIAGFSSQTERRADDAERELLEWKKLRFMRERVGEEFDALIVSVTKYGLFVELLDLFVEGLVPLSTLTGDHFTFRENTRQIIGAKTKKAYSLGGRVRVLLDRVDRVQRKLQFALVEEPMDGRDRKARRG